MAGEFRFSFGPWNIHEGADPFGPTVRDTVPFSRKLKLYKELGFDGIQFHDDDAVPALNDLSPEQIRKEAASLKKVLDDHGLTTEFVAPRLWEDPRTIDGAFTSNDSACREYAWDRAKRMLDIAGELKTNFVVLWLAREGTYAREAKDSKVAIDRIVAALNMMLEYAPNVRIAIEAKPNEPMDQCYVPTAGHAIALGLLSIDSKRVGTLIETAHTILAGLDPSDEMGFALAHNKLWSVHLNDQNGLKFDQDRSFGAVDLRRAFNQVRILDKHDFGKNGEWVGLDVKALRSQKDNVACKHLSNSRALFLKLLEISRSLDEARLASLIEQRDYEELDLFILQTLMGMR